MVKKIVWTPQARTDRYDILKYYDSQGTPKQTLKKMNSKITTIIQKLGQFPYLGKPFGEFSERIIYKDSYSIIYKEEDNSIIVLQIWDTRRNPKDGPFG